jgi:DNA-binding transcriptional ArsR family regulator
MKNRDATQHAKNHFHEFFPKGYIKKSVKVLKLLSEESRLRIMLYLAKEGPCAVSELAETLDLNITTLSHHLSLLRASDMVFTTRDGKNIYYDIHEPMWREMGLQFFKYLQKGKEVDFLGRFAVKVIEKKLREKV